MEEILSIKVKRVGNGRIPSYQTAGSSGFDLHAGHDTIIPAGKWSLVRTGLVFELPPGHEIQVRSRSGLALKHGIFVLNAPGTVDSDYRGEVGVILAKMGEQLFTVRAGDRNEQGVITTVVRVGLQTTDSLTETSRGDGGFGHTG